MTEDSIRKKQVLDSTLIFNDGIYNVTPVIIEDKLFSIGGKDSGLQSIHLETADKISKLTNGKLFFLDAPGGTGKPFY